MTVGEISAYEFERICDAIESGLSYVEIFRRIERGNWLWTPEIDIREYETRCKREIGLGLCDRKSTVTFETEGSAKKFFGHLPDNWDGFHLSGNQVYAVKICDFVGDIWDLICSYDVDLADQVLSIQLEKVKAGN